MVLKEWAGLEKSEWRAIGIMHDGVVHGNAIILAGAEVGWNIPFAVAQNPGDALCSGRAICPDQTLGDWFRELVGNGGGNRDEFFAAGHVSKS